MTKYADLGGASLVAAGVTDLGENQAQQLRDWAPRTAGPVARDRPPAGQQGEVRRPPRRRLPPLDRLEIAQALSARRQTEGLALSAMNGR